jgi:hypothetical protein
MASVCTCIFKLFINSLALEKAVRVLLLVKEILSVLIKYSRATFVTTYRLFLTYNTDLILRGQQKSGNRKLNIL